MLANPSRSCGNVNSIIRTNDLTHFNPFSVLTHGATRNSSLSVHAGHMMHLNSNIWSHTHTLHVQVTQLQGLGRFEPSPLDIVHTDTSNQHTHVHTYAEVKEVEVHLTHMFL